MGWSPLQDVTVQYRTMLGSTSAEYVLLVNLSTSTAVETLAEHLPLLVPEVEPGLEHVTWLSSLSFTSTECTCVLHSEEHGTEHTVAFLEGVPGTLTSLDLHPCQPHRVQWYLQQH